MSGRYNIDKFGQKGTPHPTSDYGILSRVEQHLYAYLRHAKRQGWNEDAIKALEIDIDQLDSFQAHYNELVWVHLRTPNQTKVIPMSSDDRVLYRPCVWNGERLNEVSEE